MQNLFSASAVSTGRARPVAQPKVPQRAGLDTRPQAVRLQALEAMMADSPQQRRLAQCKTIAGLSKGASREATNTVYFNDGKLDVGKLWQMPKTVGASRAEVLGAIAMQAGALGVEIDNKVEGRWTIASSDAGKSGVKSLDPIRVRFPAEYEAPPDRHELFLDYHFGSTWSGYVVSVTDVGKTLSHTMQEDRDTPLGPKEYSANHDVNLPGGALAGSADADAATKIAGEGARWQCVGRNPGLVRDSTRFFTNESAVGDVTDQVRYIPFNVLWKTWVATFAKTYGIGDAVVAKKLKEANVAITTSKGVSASQVMTAPSTQMDLTKDISVDAVKPQSQAALAPKELRFLYFKKNNGKVAASDEALMAQVSTARDVIGNGHGVRVRGDGGYLGDQLFGYVCEVGPAADFGGIEGYVNVESLTLGVRYPSYRETDIASLLSKHARGVEIAKGDAVFERERAAIYEKRVAYLVREILDNVEKIPGSVDLDALVRDQIIPWTPGESLPDLDDIVGEDPGTYYANVVETAAQKVETDKQARFDLAVQLALQQIKGFSLKPDRARQELKRQKQRELAPDYGLDPDSF